MVAILAISFIQLWHTALDPLVGSKLAAETVNGGDSAFIAQRLYDAGNDLTWTIRSIVSALIFIFALVFTFKSAAKKAAVMGLLITTVGLTSCKPYNTKEFVEIKPSQTAYFIPLIGENKTSQVKFDSESYEAFKKVGVKRIEIPKEWLQTGRADSEGKWIPSARVLIVDRSSITRHWTKDGYTGSTKEDQAVHVESKDSVNFTLGFRVTAYVAEEDTSKFLYYNSNRIKEASGGSYQVIGLDEILDNEVLARIQKVASVEFGSYDLDAARTKKAEVYKKIDEEVIPFFHERGITILTIAQTGGLDYENKQIQAAIDRTVMDQQLKVSALAEKEAQLVKNETIKLEAEAKASAMLTAAKAEAEAKFVVQEQVAKGMLLVADATKQTGSSDAYIRLQELEVKKELAKQYKGGVPSVLIIGGSSGTNGLTPFLPITPETLRQFDAAAKSGN